MFWHTGRTQSVGKFDTQTFGEEFYRVEIEKLVTRYQKCLYRNDDYIE